MRVREWLMRLAGTIRPRRSEPDLRDELRCHLELADEDAKRRGEPVRMGRVRAGGAAWGMGVLRGQRGLVWLGAVRGATRVARGQLRRPRPGKAGAVLSL